MSCVKRDTIGLSSPESDVWCVFAIRGRLQRQDRRSAVDYDCVQVHMKAMKATRKRARPRSEPRTLRYIRDLQKLERSESSETFSIL